MSDRPSALQRIQVGVEGTAGTYANVTRLLRSATIQVQPQGEFDQIRASGFLVDTMTAENREWVSAPFTMEPDYNEIVYVLASAVARPSAGTPTFAGSTAAGTAHLWTFTPNSNAGNTLSTLTVEHGDANHAEAFPYGHVTDLTLEVTRQNASLTGTLVGQRLIMGASLTGGAAVVSDIQRPMLPGQFSIYLDDTAATLGTTKLTRDFRLVLGIGNRQGQVWPVDAANASYATTVESAPTWTATLQVGADATGTALFGVARRGETKFLRVVAQAGTTVGGTHTYQMVWDAALQCINAPSPGDADGLHVWEYQFTNVYDATWAKHMTVGVKNVLAAF